MFTSNIKSNWKKYLKHEKKLAKIQLDAIAEANVAEKFEIVFFGFKK